MKARPEAAAGIDRARPTDTLASGDTTPRHPRDDVPGRALAPVDALLALAAFNANQAVTAQIDFAHSFARALQGHAELTEAGARAFAPGPMRNAVVGAAGLEAHYARQVAQAAQALGRRFGHLAFAFPAATPFR
jgi:hypothetical protein